MRRILPRAILALFLGLLTTIATALALAAWMPFDVYPRHTTHDFIADGRPWNAVGRYRRGIHHIWWHEYNPDYVTAPTPPKEIIRNSLRALTGKPKPPGPSLPTTPEGWMDYARRERAARTTASPLTPHDTPPPWGTFASAKAPPRDEYSGTDFGYGWPFPALWYRIYGGAIRNVSFATRIEGGHLLTHPSSISTVGYTHRALPYTPHYRGLLANSALFAAAWALLLFTPPLLRRTLRRRRGQCLRCGYDLAATPTQTCPECGTPATRR